MLLLLKVNAKEEKKNTERESFGSMQERRQSFNAIKEPSEVVQGFSVNMGNLNIHAASSSANEGKANEDEAEDGLRLPRTPRGEKKSTNENERDNELMTPRSLSRRIGKPDIKVMLATGNNEPFDVMRGRGIVTSMTLRAKADGIKRVPENGRNSTSRSSSNSNSNNTDSNKARFSKNDDDDFNTDEDEGDVKLVLPTEVLRRSAASAKKTTSSDSQGELIDDNNDDDDDGTKFDDPKEYRKLMVKLSDLSYIHIKAAVGVDNATGNVIERDFWLPLDQNLKIGDVKRYVEEANTLETMKMMRQHKNMITNGSAGAANEARLNTHNNNTTTTASKLAPVNEDEELESVVLLKGRELDDSRRLMDENVTHNTTLHFYIKKDAQNVRVKMHGSRDVELNLKADETAESLRGKISALSSSLGARTHDGSNQLDLFYGAKALKDGPLSNYGVRAGATLELRPHVPMRQHIAGAMNIPRNNRLLGRSSVSGESRSYGSGYDTMSRSLNSNSGSRAGSQQKSPRLSWGSHLGNNNGLLNGQFGASADRITQSHQHVSGSFMRSHSLRSSNSTIDSVSPPEQPITPIGSFDMARQGLLAGVHPMLSSGGTGGAYFLKSTVGETVAVFKPADEEPLAKNNPRGNSWMNNFNEVNSALQSSPGEGMRKGTKVGEGAAREVAAYLLDHDGFSGVPVTSLANLSEHSVFFSGDDDDILQRENENSGKLGSIQEFIKADAEAEEFGPSLFPLHEVHKITVLDIRLANTDRNAGNILVKKDEKTDKIVSLIPIDHGYALPHTLEDVCFEWEFWPQAKKPYSQETKEYIETLDADEDIEYLRDNDIELHSSSERVLKICTLLLKKCAKLDIPPADIASIMSRSMPNRMSDVEKIVAKAASTAICAVRSERGELVHKAPKNGSFWNDLDEEGSYAETIFAREYEKALDAYLLEKSATAADSSKIIC
mgnify:FL=1